MDPSLLFMSVREFQYDIAISEIQEYEEDLKLKGLSRYELSYRRTTCSIILEKIYDEKIRWESSGKSFLVMSPVEIISSFYDLYERGVEKATSEESKEIFQIAYRVSGEILERFL